mmetsp:Transcript_145330/g.267105  ORF Transcript_145330/g.267105 Transcript_145330/m.267105 type:complete len:621 (+) Transcript_145330:53-1915(+)
MSAPLSYGATGDAKQKAVVMEKFEADRMDPTALSLDVGMTVTVMSTEGNWANVKTASGQTGQIPATCLKMDSLDPNSAQTLLVMRGTYPPPSGTFFKGAVDVEKKSKVEEFAPFACEFLGTFILTFTVACCSIGELVPYGPAAGPVAVGLVLVVLIYALGPVSGGNLNPAVTLTLYFLGRMRFPVLFGYFLAQFCAALLAGIVIFLTFSQSVVVGPLSPYGWATVGLCEIVFTATVCFVFAACAPSASSIRSQGNQFYALAIGFVFVAGGFACGTISNAMFNPAVAIGLDVAYFADGFWNGLIFGLYEAIGALVAFFMVKSVGKDQPQDSLGMLGAFAESPSPSRRCLSEFIGTLVVVFVFGLNVITASYATALSVGAALMSMSYALSDVSGAHFNPAVTLAVFLAGRQKCEAGIAVIYVAMQILAGIIAGFVLTFVHESGANASVFGLVPKGDNAWTQVAISEVIFTFLLTWVVLSVSTVTQAFPGLTSLSTPPRQNAYSALAIGSCMIVAGIAVGAISGGIVNPAISVGLSVEMSTVVTENTITPTTASPTLDPTLLGPPLWEWIYSHFAGYHNGEFVPRFVNFVWFSLFELAGGLLGALIFHGTHSHEYYAKNALPS